MQRWMPGGALDRETPTSFSADTLTGTPGQVIERLATLAALGVEELIVAPAPLPFAVPDASMLDVLAGAVFPTAREL